MANLKVSAILPCYNHAKFLPERIKSILGQRFPVSEIIFLDDASSDNSVELARSLLHNTTIDVIFNINSSNSGSPYAQWNRGVKMAKYEVIWIAETDDSSDPAFLESLVKRYQIGTSSIVFSQSRYISSKSEDLGSLLSYSSRYWPNCFRDDFVMDGRQFNLMYMTRNCAIPNASAVIFSRNAFLNAGMSNESMYFSGDWDIWTRIASRGIITFLSDELNLFRTHHDTTRAKGITPRSAAERLACRINAFNQSKANQISVINPAWILTSGEFYKYPLLAIPWRVFSFKNILEIKAYYCRLKRVPLITKGAWLSIVFTSLISKLLIACSQLNANFKAKTGCQKNAI